MYVEGEAVEVSWSNQLCYLQPVSKEWFLALSAYLPSNLRIASWPAKAFNISLCPCFRTVVLTYESALVKAQASGSVGPGWDLSIFHLNEFPGDAEAAGLENMPHSHFKHCTMSPYMQNNNFLHNNKCIMFTPSFQKDNNTARYIF